VREERRAPRQGADAAEDVEAGAGVVRRLALAGLRRQDYRAGRGDLRAIRELVVRREAAHEAQRYGLLRRDAFTVLRTVRCPERTLHTREISFGLRPGYSALRLTMRRRMSGGIDLRLRAESEPKRLSIPCASTRVTLRRSARSESATGEGGEKL
jgi:hypothetical protein